MSPRMFTAIAVLATAGLPVSFSALAQTADAPAPESANFDKSKDCAARREDNNSQLEAIRNSRPDEDAMRALLLTAVQSAAANSICLADMLGTSDDDIAALLANIASTEGDIEPAAGEVEPADGPGTGQDNNFAPTESVGNENPSQLNETVNSPAASPIVPVVSVGPSE